ncbi:dTMP kinase [Cohnella nanjingensis]|uniref:Thymidylate kinase n=1 Tax=Cohnella nanjingensis TaxID=1387779 RepID=A0A7X0RZF1_9BACL|nr:dTMP kinase [Cohnella nanjingensis]MBB6674884.1 dTMP kinase [Cohnella nanjingensis]
MTQGRFITIEGGEGAGKTTLIGLLAQRCEAQGREVVTTREPGGIPIAEAIRAVILDKANTAMDARTEALLYAAARRQHLAEKVMPAIARGAVVICDRFVDSSLAYQGHARGLGFDEVWEINRFATEGCMPDLTLYLDIAPEAGLARIHADADREVNRLDLEGLAFHRRVREGFRQAAERFPERIVTLDASASPDRIADAAWAQVEARLSH